MDKKSIKKNVAKSDAGWFNQIRENKGGDKIKILAELQKIHKNKFEFALRDNKIVLIKRLKPQFREGVVCIPEEIDVLGEGAFANQNDIIKIVFPEHQIEVEEKACFNCINLTELICLNASKIGDFAFAKE